MFSVILSCLITVWGSSTDVSVGNGGGLPNALLGWDIQQLIGQFFPPKEFVIPVAHMEWILINKQVFAPEGKPDPFDLLMTQLDVKNRISAVQHFMKHNEAELQGLSEEMVKTTGPVGALSFSIRRSQPQNSFIQLAGTLYKQVSRYVQNRESRCMYDYVPMEFRDPVKYDTLFTELTSEAFQAMRKNSRVSDMQGVYTYVDNDAFFESDSTHVFQDPETGILRLNTNSSSKFIHTTCGADLHTKYARYSFYPGKRALMGVDSDLGTGLIWRQDSITPVIIPFPKGSRVDFAASNDAYYFAYEGPTDWDPSHVPRFVLLPWRGDLLRSFLGGQVGAAIPTGTFKISAKLSEPAVAKPLKYYRENAQCAEYTTSVDDHFSGGIEWDLLYKIKRHDTGEVAICFPSVERFFQYLKNAWVCVQKFGDDWAKGVGLPLTNHRRQVLNYMVGASDYAPASMTENQLIMKEVIKLAKEEKMYEAWSIIAGSSLLSDYRIDDTYLVKILADETTASSEVTDETAGLL